jgi:hypothetical protein
MKGKKEGGSRKPRSRSKDDEGEVEDVGLRTWGNHVTLFSVEEFDFYFLPFDRDLMSVTITENFWILE